MSSRSTKYGFGRGDPDPATLANRVMHQPTVLRQDRHRPSVTISPGTVTSGRRSATKSAYERLPTKQISWLSALSATGKPNPRASVRTSGLVSWPSGNCRNRSCSCAKRIEHVALVLAVIDRPEQLGLTVDVVGLDPHVVPSRQAIGAQLLRALHEMPELDVPIAFEARIRRAPGRILVDELR